MAGHVIVIGAGVGGLAAAIRLAAAGCKVTVLERAWKVGGKMCEEHVREEIFDGGPTVLTMPWVFDELFGAAGVRRQDFVEFVPLSPACRHFFADGRVLDLYNDDPDAPEPWARSAGEIGRVLGARAAEQYRAYRRHAAGIYRAVERPFLLRALPRSPLLLPFTHDPRDAFGVLKLDSRRTLWQSLGRFFDDPHLRVLFARYATYCGSDPFLAPATLSVIPHVELAFGVHAVSGGMYRLAAALHELAGRLGVEVERGADVVRVELDPSGRRAVGVHFYKNGGTERLGADAVVANCDAAQLFGRLLRGTRRGERHAREIAALPASLSAHLLLCVAKRADGLPLADHNVFFSADYEREFADLTGASRLPDDPTVYLHTSPGKAAGLSRWYFLVNAPPLAESSTAPRPMSQEARAVRERIGASLRRHQIDLDTHEIESRSITPRDFAVTFPGSRGALYGAAGNSRTSAFHRPPNRVRDIANLYCVGGSTHPGAGVPMVALSARITADLVLQRLR